MKSIEIFRKNGYKQRHDDNNCVIYDLKEKLEYSLLPDTIIIRKGSKEIEFETDSIEEHTSLGTFSFCLNKELLQAIDKKLEE